MSAQARLRLEGWDGAFEARARRALEENFWSRWSQFGRAPGCALHESAAALWYETPIPTPPYNMVIRYRGGDRDDAAIDAIFAHFKARGVPFLWFMHPSTTPADLPARLRARGLEEVEEIAGMAADLAALPAAPPVPRGFELHDVTPEHDFGPFIECVAKRWHVPDASLGALVAIGAANRIGAPGSSNRAWIVVKDGAPVSKAFTHDFGDSVGLYGMATVAEARGHGLARLVLLAALNNAKSRGHRLAVLHSTPMAKPLYASTGFRELAPFHFYAAPHAFYA
jgi:GNAT superfamily N-acetyltransferase